MSTASLHQHPPSPEPGNPHLSAARSSSAADSIPLAHPSPPGADPISLAAPFPPAGRPHSSSPSPSPGNPNMSAAFSLAPAYPNPLTAPSHVAAQTNSMAASYPPAADHYPSAAPSPSAANPSPVTSPAPMAASSPLATPAFTPFPLGSFKAPQAACNKPPAKQTPEGLKRISFLDEAVQNSLHQEAERSHTDQHKQLTKGSKQCQKAELNQKEMLEGKADSAVGKRVHNR